MEKIQSKSLISEGDQKLIRNLFFYYTSNREIYPLNEGYLGWENFIENIEKKWPGREENSFSKYVSRRTHNDLEKAGYFWDSSVNKFVVFVGDVPRSCRNISHEEYTLIRRIVLSRIIEKVVGYTAHGINAKNFDVFSLEPELEVICVEDRI